MGRLTDYFGILESEDLEEHKLLLDHLDVKKDWKTIIEGRKQLKKLKKAGPSFTSLAQVG